MAQSSNRIITIYKSRNTILHQLEQLDYKVSDYTQFSINEIDAMYANDQLDMLLTRESDGVKVYVKYWLNIKQLRKDNLDQLIEDLYDIENILEKKDTLIVITNSDPNDTVVQKLKYLYDHSNIFLVVHSIRRLQFNILDHSLVPIAIILKTEEIDEVKKKYHVETVEKFPEISRFDPQAMALCLRPGQVIKISRQSNTAMHHNHYRVCV
jgi:DNA-directed RNA polymerase subunit H (RpoH/RPB5)